MIKTNLDTMTEDELNAGQIDILNDRYTIQELAEACDALRPYYSDSDLKQLNDKIKGGLSISVDINLPVGLRTLNALEEVNKSFVRIFGSFIYGVYVKRRFELIDNYRKSKSLKNVNGERPLLFGVPIVYGDFFSNKDQMDE